MNKIKKILAIVIFILICVAAVFFIEYKNKSSKFFSTKADPTIVIATSKFGDIYQKDLDEYVSKIQKFVGYKIEINNISEDEKSILINEIVNQKKVLQDAIEAKVEETEAFKTREQETKNDLLKEIYLQNQINAYLTEDLLKSKYEELKEGLEGKKEYKVKHILVKEETDIKKVVAELKTKTFDEVAKKYSIDTTAQNGGDLGYVLDGQTVEEFNEVLKTQKINEVSKPFKTKFGWHVLIKEDERKVKVPSFKDTEETLKTSLTAEFIKNLTEQNIKEADIQIKR